MRKWRGERREEEEYRGNREEKKGNKEEKRETKRRIVDHRDREIGRKW